MEHEQASEGRPVYVFGDFRLEVAERRLYRGGTLIPLARKVFDLLLLLVEPAGRLKTREELIQALWPDSFVEEQNLTAKVHALRKALGDEGGEPQYIETVRGVGYRFMAPVTVDDESYAGPRDGSPARHFGGPAGVALGLAVVLAAGLTSWQLLARHGKPHGNPGATAGRIPVVAVLPFKNLGPDEGATYLAGGMQATLISRLAGARALRVVSRASVARYASHPQSLTDVANRLGATDVLEGSVSKSGQHVRIKVRLIDARSHHRIWANTYNRSSEHLFAVEGEIAGSVAHALDAGLGPGEAARLKRPATHNPRAYSDFLKATYYARRALRDDSATNPLAATRKALSFYRSAITQDPGFALAYARLSLLESAAHWFEIDNDPSLVPAAESNASKAAALDSGLPEAHMALGYAAYYGHLDYATALRQFAVAAKAKPDDPEIIASAAYIHRRKGQWKQALTELKRATLLDPANPRWHNETGITDMALRHYGAADEQFRQALAITPDNYDVLNRRMSVLILTGRLQTLNATLAQVPRRIDPQGLFSSLRFEAAWLEDRPGRALKALSHGPKWVVSQDELGLVPKLLLEGRVRAYQGRRTAARTCYRGARKLLESAVQKSPGNADLWSALGVAEAALGQREAALTAGKRAMQLIPVSSDALSGPAYLVSMARIDVLLGDKNRALTMLARVMEMPAGRVLSTRLLRRDPIWDPLHGDPRYRVLIHRSAPGAASRGAGYAMRLPIRRPGP